MSLRLFFTELQQTNLIDYVENSYNALNIHLLSSVFSFEDFEKNLRDSINLSSHFLPQTIRDVNDCSYS